MSLSSDPKVVDTAQAISRYLSTRPDASETVDGVARWWLMRQRYDDSRELVQQALDYLEAQGFVVKSTMPGGQVMYGPAVHPQTQFNSNYSISAEEQ